MKPDIHPNYAATEVTCTCGATFVTRSTAKNGVIHADVCSQCHPFYTGKQKILDTGGRVARFEKRFGKKADAGTTTSSSPTPAPGLSPGCRRRFASAPSTGPGRARSGRRKERTAVFDSITDLLAEHAVLEARMADPAVHGDPGEARRLGRRYAELTPIVEAQREWAEVAGRPRRRRRTGRGGRVVQGRDPGADRAPAEIEERLRDLLLPARPAGRQGRHRRDQGGGGRRGVGPVRGRPAAHVPALRRAAGLEDRGAGVPGVGPRRLQGRRDGREGPPRRRRAPVSGPG